MKKPSHNGFEGQAQGVAAYIEQACSESECHSYWPAHLRNAASIIMPYSDAYNASSDRERSMALSELQCEHALRICIIEIQQPSQYCIEIAVLLYTAILNIIILLLL